MGKLTQAVFYPSATTDIDISLSQGSSVVKIGSNTLFLGLFPFS